MKAILMSLMLIAISACGSASEPNRHTGDRIANPTRIPAGQHVRILEVGEGDPQYDAGQSFKGVVCSVGKSGLSSGWTDALFEGTLEHCSNGNKSYRFQYVRVESITQS